MRTLCKQLAYRSIFASHLFRSSGREKQSSPMAVGWTVRRSMPIFAPLQLRSFIRHPCADGGRDRRDYSRGDAARHTRPYRTTLTANCSAVAVFVLINGAAIVRVCATWRTAQMANLLLIGGALWIAAFLLFELIYGPMLLTRREGS